MPLINPEILDHVIQANRLTPCCKTGECEHCAIVRDLATNEAMQSVFNNILQGLIENGISVIVDAVAVGFALAWDYNKLVNKEKTNHVVN